MDYINALLENETVPALTAILLGLMTAISPCPMGTNIVAIGYISRDLESRKKMISIFHPQSRAASLTF